MAASSTETPDIIAARQINEINRVYDFFDGKSDWELTETFDYKNLIAINIEVQRPHKLHQCRPLERFPVSTVR